jgi:hypothetical protein
MSDIPLDIQEFCKAVAKVAKDHGMSNLHGTFRPNWKSEWRHDVSFSWEQGRHGENADRITISSQVTINAKLNAEG